MTHPSERTPHGGLGRLVAATVLFAVLAPVASAAAPLAALLLVSRPRSTAEVVLAGAAAGFSLWWLVQRGDLPDQLAKGTIVLTTAGFVVLTVRTRMAFLPRALASLGGATAGITALLAVLGSSWGELRWWVEHRTSMAARMVAGQLGRGSENAFDQLEVWLATVVKLAADYFPAITVLQLLAGLALATAIYQRVTRTPMGSPLKPFRQFRFSEHFGWVAVIALVAALVPKLAAAKLAAGNVLVVTGALYALRGAAVVAFGLGFVGGGSVLLRVFLAVIFFFMLPVFVGSAILLGVLDTGVDFRRRWTAPRVGK